MHRAFPGLTYRGPTGLLLVPTGQILQNRRLAFGIHRGVMKMGYGALSLAEIGVSGPDLYDDPDKKAWKEDSLAFVKLGTEASALKWWLPGIACGAENSFAETAEGYYFCATWHAAPFRWPLEATIGAGTGRFEDRGFGAVGLIPAGLLGRTFKIFGEMAGNEADLGLRIALSRNLRLDFAMLFDVVAPEEAGDSGWSITIDRGLPGTSMAADLFSIYRAVIPEKKKRNGR